MTTPQDERIATLINHAEFLADEASDLHMHDITDRLRLLGSRLAIDGEVIESALRAAAFQHNRRAEKLVQLRAANQRVELELATQFPRDVAAAYLSAARVSPLETARFRLRRLTESHRLALGNAVLVLERAVTEAERAIDDSLAATARLFVARAGTKGREHRLRLELERSKASMLAVLPVDSAAASRIRRRVVRTRRPDRDSFWPSAEGDPVDGE
jgi:hypothetical protein